LHPQSPSAEFNYLRCIPLSSLGAFIVTHPCVEIQQLHAAFVSSPFPQNSIGNKPREENNFTAVKCIKTSCESAITRIGVNKYPVVQWSKMNFK